MITGTKRNCITENGGSFMFVNYSILKKMIKAAYEHHVLTVACTPIIL